MGDTTFHFRLGSNTKFSIRLDSRTAHRKLILTGCCRITADSNRIFTGSQCILTNRSRRPTSCSSVTTYRSTKLIRSLSKRTNRYCILFQSRCTITHSNSLFTEHCCGHITNRNRIIRISPSTRTHGNRIGTDSAAAIIVHIIFISTVYTKETGLIRNNRSGSIISYRLNRSIQSGKIFRNTLRIRLADIIPVSRYRTDTFT